ncbi:MAG: hypothetical protein AAGK23_04610 [Pseudomonadota bacterium]
MLGGILKSLFNPVNLASLAFGPAGWAALATRTLTNAIATEVIQRAGDLLNLPQPLIDMAQARFAFETGQTNIGFRSLGEAVDGLQEALGWSDVDAGSIQRQGQDAIAQMLNEMNLDGARRSGRGLSNGEGQSLLVALAIALGQVADDKLERMYEITQELGNLDSGDQGYAQLTGELQAVGQEMKFVSEALSNSIKSIGESAQTLARKN